MFRNKAEAVTSLNELYTVGSFAQVVEMRDLGSVIELILNAQRRIRLLEPIMDQEEPSVSKINGRRAGRKREDKAEKKEKKDEQAEKVEPLVDKEPHIIYGRTENVIIDPIDKTVEVKVCRAIASAMKGHSL